MITIKITRNVDVLRALTRVWRVTIAGKVSK